MKSKDSQSQQKTYTILELNTEIKQVLWGSFPELIWVRGEISNFDKNKKHIYSVLQGKNKLKIILSPSIQERCSILLKRTNAPITYLNDVKNKVSLSNKEKAPIKDEP